MPDQGGNSPPVGPRVVGSSGEPDYDGLVGGVHRRPRGDRIGWRWASRGLALVGSVFAVWFVFRRLDLVALGAQFRSMRWGWYLAAHGLFSLGMLGSALRWHLMLRLNPAAAVHGAASVRMVFISQFFNTLLGGPSGGDLPKTAFYSRWFGVAASDVLAASVLDRLTASVGGLAFVGMALAAGAFSGAFAVLPRLEWRPPGPWVGPALVGVVLVGGALLVFMVRRPESFLGRSFRAFGRSARQLVASGPHALRAMGCAAFTAAMFNLGQILCLQAVTGEAVPVLKLLWLYQGVTIAAALPVTFAGAGLREGAAMVLLAPFGVPATAAVAGALLTLSIHVTWALFGAVLLWREHRLRSRAPAVPKVQTISAVVPTLNESAELRGTLERLHAIPEVVEILVVDGGSDDGTPALAESLGCQVIRSPRGRGQQLRAGAVRAVGDVVLLVHADTWIPPGAGAAVLRCLRDPLVAGGGFWKRFRRPPLIMRGSRFRCWLRLWWNGWVFGDQAIFVRRPVLEAIGGVPDQRLMEEVELCRRLRRAGRLVLAGATVTASERRFVLHGVLRTYLRMWRVLRGYRRGLSPDEMERLYEHG